MGVCELESKERVEVRYLGWSSLPSHLLLSLAHDGAETTASSLPGRENLMSAETQSMMLSSGGFLTLLASPLLYPGSLASWDFSQISYLHSCFCLRICLWGSPGKDKALIRNNQFLES